MSSSLLVSQHLIPSKSSLGLQCWKSSSPYLILRQNTSMSKGEFKVSAREFNKISSSPSLQAKRLRDDDDDLQLQILNPSPTVSAREFNKLHDDNDDHLQLHQELMPKHIALIMDGNRRWAKAKGLQVYEGHKLITPKLKEICDVSSKLGIQVITAFAFSTENWKRSKEEVDFLMQLFEEFFNEFMRFGVRVSVVGCKSNLPITLQKCIALTEETTKANVEGLHLVVALNYGGHYDILQATKSSASKVMNGLLHPEDINMNLFEQELESKCPDLLIRTGGEQRVSNFLLWQLAYSEFYFTNTLFPDFGEKELKEAILNFQQRHRRFGGHTY